MIFVTVGTNEAPFDRLLEAVAALPQSVPGEEVVVQRGSSDVRPPAAQVVDFLSFDRLVSEVRRARVVVTHAGVGSVLVALTNGRRPIVMPRMRRHGEAVDDHQIAFAERFEKSGFVTVVRTGEELADAVTRSHRAHEIRLADDGALVHDVGTYLAACVAA
jgi:UDP-N-acetylglucosamine transferase subunit ALG13